RHRREAVGAALRGELPARELELRRVIEAGHAQQLRGEAREAAGVAADVEQRARAARDDLGEAEVEDAIRVEVIEREPAGPGARVEPRQALVDGRPRAQLGEAGGAAL